MSTYHYSVEINEIMVYGETAVVRLVWALEIDKAGSPTQTIEEPAVDIFHRQADGGWKISRYLAYPCLPVRAAPSARHREIATPGSLAIRLSPLIRGRPPAVRRTSPARPFMPLFVIPFPAIDPVAISIGPFAIRWYALAYIVGLLIGWRYCLGLAGRPPHLVGRQDVDDFLVWATLGVVLGGRIGYVLFYKPGYYIYHPIEALYVWHGGMSFHGGALGVTIAIILFTRARRIPLFAFSDIITEAIPIGLFFGRIANFINGELYGRPSNVPWAMIFPNGGPVPRHPSQLYEAFCEGILLFILLFAAERLHARQRPGVVTGLFLAGYAAARMSGELFREPDPQLGFLIFGTTMGQLLSIPLLIAGILIIAWALRAPVPARS